MSLLVCDSMTLPALSLSHIDQYDGTWSEELDLMLKAYSNHLVENGSFAPGDTRFAVGHYTEDRDVWFDILTVTLDDIIKECGIPEERREQQKLRHRFYAEYFLRHHDGPEKTVPLLEE